MRDRLIELGFDKWLSKLEIAPYPIIFWDIPLFIQMSYIQKWLREEKATSVDVFTSKEGDKVFQISSDIIDFYNVSVDWESFKSLKTYEEALEAGLKKALELIK